ncbi:MAG: 4-hydroxy-tetrahydrodipicolinate synthase [Bacteroidales bacterium]|nr:4-hydroxy-tetrahydrodipicolinate synthase [Bacteroidales bacterium]
MEYQFSGTGVAIVTPFNKDLTIDYNAFEGLINHVIKGKLEYIVVLGTTGESVTLSKDEKKELVSFCVEKTAGRVPIVVGIGGNNTQDVLENISKQDFTGISGVLSVSPYYNKPSQEGIYQHFKSVAEKSPKPVIIYNVPGRTGSNIKAETTIRLANDCKNIVAVKEASGDLPQIMQIIKNKPSGFEVLSGDCALTYPMIALGVKGVISVIANSHPLQYGGMIRDCLQGNWESAQKVQYDLLDYIKLLFDEGSPAGIKAALSQMGLCKNIVRLPVTTVSKELFEKIEKQIAAIG